MLVRVMLMRAKPAERGKPRHDKQACACPQISISSWQHSMLNQLHTCARTIETVSDNVHASPGDFEGAQHCARFSARRCLNCAS
eukprot:2086711-Lingulodinium_polyedra.AAC.1